MSEVSVLIPSFNHAPFIERTLRSVFNQTLKPAKLLVIDDGSTDGSRDVISRVMEDCPFESEVIGRENRGLCRTLNEGFGLLSEPFFAYLGSDDLWLPDFLGKSVRLLEKRPAACLSFGDAYLIDDEDFVIDTTDNWADFQDKNVRSQLLRGKIFPSAGVVYRRGHLPEKPWDENSRLEDYDLYLRLSEEYDFAYLDGLYCAWRQHRTNTSENLPVMFPEFMMAHEKALKRSEMNGDEGRRIKKQVAFDAAFNFVRYGYRKEALKMMVANMSGADSPFAVVDLLFRIAIPGSVFKWNRERKRKEARKKHGKLDELIARNR